MMVCAENGESNRETGEMEKALRERLETLGLCAIIRHVEETELYATAQNREGN